VHVITTAAVRVLEQPLDGSAHAARFRRTSCWKSTASTSSTTVGKGRHIALSDEVVLCLGPAVNRAGAGRNGSVSASAPTAVGVPS
jgi:hypothetical protein